MSMHPNVILLLALTPDDLARETYRSILKEVGVEEDNDIKIGNTDYHHHIMESDYYETYQISAKEGDMIVFDLITYEYGEVVEWSKFEQQKNELEAWAKIMCEKFNCGYKILVMTNYW